MYARTARSKKSRFGVLIFSFSSSSVDLARSVIFSDARLHVNPIHFLARMQCRVLMRLSMLASTPPPTRDRVGNFPCLKWQACPRGRDIESLKCASEHTQRVSHQDLNSNVARWVWQLDSNLVKSPSLPHLIREGWGGGGVGGGG